MAGIQEQSQEEIEIWESPSHRDRQGLGKQ